MHDQLAVELAPAEISDAVVVRLRALYQEHLPLLPAARETVISSSKAWPLGLASSANRPIIGLVLELGALRDCFAATVSSRRCRAAGQRSDVCLRAVITRKIARHSGEVAT